MIIITARIPSVTFPRMVALASFFSASALVFGLIHQPYETAMSLPSFQEESPYDYLQSLGWQVEQEPIRRETVEIPLVLDESFGEYLQLQDSQGFPSLTLYQGKEVQRETYRILNYPTGAEEILLNILLYQGEIIAGEVLSPEINGFLHGLDYLR